jgi:guanyl-specific ribonuclease Sa
LKGKQPSPYAGRSDWPHNEGVYGNREGRLPPQEDDEYYTEHGVPGQERVVSGKNDEIYYSPNHGETFYRVE